MFFLDGCDRLSVIMWAQCYQINLVNQTFSVSAIHYISGESHRKNQEGEKTSERGKRGGGMNKKGKGRKEGEIKKVEMRQGKRKGREGREEKERKRREEKEKERE